MMEVREAGASGLKLSVVGFGCWQLGQKGEADYWGTEVTQEVANKLVKGAFESGVRRVMCVRMQSPVLYM